MQSLGPAKGQARIIRSSEDLLTRGIAVQRRASRLPALSGGRRLVRGGPQRIWLGRLASQRARGRWLTLSLLFLASAIGYGATIGGQTERLFNTLTNGVAQLAVAGGLGIERVTIEGSRHASNAEITKALAADPDSVMLGFDTDAAKARLEAVPWIKHARVTRWLPSTLQVVIEERQPYAIWQSKGQTYVVDGEGAVITPALREAYPQLPFVVGDGAGRHAKALQAELADFDELNSKMLAALRVGDRRWTLKLISGLEIMLPDDNIGEALGSLTKLDRDRRLLDKNIAFVDLRLLDRITLRMHEPVPADALDTTAPSEVPTASTKPTPTDGKT